MVLDCVLSCPDSATTLLAGEALPYFAKDPPVDVRIVLWRHNPPDSKSNLPAPAQASSARALDTKRHGCLNTDYPSIVSHMNEY